MADSETAPYVEASDKPGQSESQKPADVKKSHPLRRALLIAAGIVVLILLVIWGIHYWTVGQYFVSTDDAYLQANSSIIAPKVSGYVTSVPVNDNQEVAKGQLLLSIDDRDGKVALMGARADVDAAKAAIMSDQAQVYLQGAKIAQAQANVVADQARLNFAVLDSRRYARASASGASTEQSSSQANTQMATAQAVLDADQAALIAAHRQINVLNATLAQSLASLAQSRSRLAQAALNLGYTRVYAPYSGQIANKTVAVGDYLQIGTQVMAVVPLDQVYVTANYKETQLGGILPGQKVTVVVDSFPSLKVTGTVDSIAASSGQEFALLPPDNATGNFTKIVQRVPVKIVLNLDKNLIGKLRPGMSVEPDIDTRHSGQ